MKIKKIKIIIPLIVLFIAVAVLFYYNSQQQPVSFNRLLSGSNGIGIETTANFSDRMILLTLENDQARMEMFGGGGNWALGTFSQTDRRINFYWDEFGYLDENTGEAKTSAEDVSGLFPISGKPLKYKVLSAEEKNLLGNNEKMTYDVLLEY
ncbi:MAG: hypothetical protein FWF00_03690 [Endomicrobia bacterium]|nr:hypothetical protein [Endomicrobiia bacterium]MCL2506775.1 hypothetical protein [Endomicrobiia bacterium]